MLTSIMIGNKISQARKDKNLSQAQLAQQLSVSSQAVGKWERGESMPDIMTFDRLAQALGVDLNYFSESFQPSAGEKASGGPSGEQAAAPQDKKKQTRLGWDMSYGDWADADFSGLRDLHEKFRCSNMRKCLFIGSDMSGLLLKNNNIDGCDFSDSELANSRFLGSNMVNNVFRGCSLRQAEFSSSHIKGCDFSGADFTGARVNACTFMKNVTAGAVWNRTAFYATEFIDIVLDGVWKDCSFENCELSRLTFKNATLTNTFFKNGNMKRARLIDCQADKMTYAFLKSAKADLTGVTLLTP